MSADAAASRVVVGEERRAGLRVAGGEAVGARLLGLLGAAFLVVGLVDLALLWRALDFGNVAWEYATLSRTLDSVPMSGLGLGLLAFGALRSPGKRAGLWVRVLGVGFLIAAVGFIVMGALYATAIPDVIQRTAPPAMEGLSRAIVKNSVEAVVYTVVFGVVGWKLWSAVERT